MKLEKNQSDMQKLMTTYRVVNWFVIYVHQSSTQGRWMILKESRHADPSVNILPPLTTHVVIPAVQLVDLMAVTQV